jgi:hypothetical protein
MIPGPFWPSITQYYVVKYNLFNGRSQFYLQVEKLHQQYDIVTDYSFDNCYNQLDTPDFGAEFFDMTGELSPRGWVLQAFPILGPISNLVTLGLAKRVNTALYHFLQFRKVIPLTLCLSQRARDANTTPEMR